MTTVDDLQTSAPADTAGADVVDLSVRVTRIRMDGRLDVEGPGGPAVMGAEAGLTERELRALAATADPMAMPDLPGVLAGVDPRGLRAAGATLEEALATYTQEFAVYRGVAAAAATIVRFALQADPARRRVLQEEVAQVLGLQAATEPGGPLHAQRAWLDALTVFSHYLQLRAPQEFLYMDGPDPDCLCLAHLTVRANDPDLAPGVLGADTDVAAALEGTGLVVMPVGVSDYLRHRDTCPRATGAKTFCSCGLSDLMGMAAP